MQKSGNFHLNFFGWKMVHSVSKTLHIFSISNDLMSEHSNVNVYRKSSQNSNWLIHSARFFLNSWILIQWIHKKRENSITNESEMCIIYFFVQKVRAQMPFSYFLMYFVWRCCFASKPDDLNKFSFFPLFIFISLLYYVQKVHLLCVCIIIIIIQPKCMQYMR